MCGRRILSTYTGAQLPPFTPASPARLLYSNSAGEICALAADTQGVWAAARYQSDLLQQIARQVAVDAMLPTEAQHRIARVVDVVDAGEVVWVRHTGPGEEPPRLHYVGFTDAQGKMHLRSLIPSSPKRRPTGWLSPTGVLYPCGAWQHEHLADALQLQLQGNRAGWCRVSDGHAENPNEEQAASLLRLLEA